MQVHIFKIAFLFCTSSSIKKPRSAIMTSPSEMLLRNPDVVVIVLSDASDALFYLPPYDCDMNIAYPVEIMAMSYLSVLDFLYSEHCHAAAIGCDDFCPFTSKQSIITVILSTKVSLKHWGVYFF